MEKEAIMEEQLRESIIEEVCRMDLETLILLERFLNELRER